MKRKRVSTVVLTLLPVLAFGLVYWLSARKAQAGQPLPGGGGGEGGTSEDIAVARAELRMLEAKLAELGVRIAMTAGDPSLAGSRAQLISEFSSMNAQRARLKARIEGAAR